MFKVHLLKQIFDADRPEVPCEVLTFSKAISLPFAPFPELLLEGSPGERERVISVAWRLQEGCFVCQVEDEYLKEETGYSSFLARASLLKTGGWTQSAVRLT